MTDIESLDSVYRFAHLVPRRALSDKSKTFRLPFAQPLRPFRLFHANQAVAVRVQELEIRRGAEELAAGHVAVAVAVHVPEPQRPARRNLDAGGGTVSRRRHAAIHE